jgi:hypothetical protein
MTWTLKAMRIKKRKRRRMTKGTLGMVVVEAGQAVEGGVGGEVGAVQGAGQMRR